MQIGSLSEGNRRHAFGFQRGANALEEVCDHAGKHKAYPDMLANPHSHTAMCRGEFRRRRMERTPDERRELLRLFIKERGLKVARWAKESGVDKNSIYNFLNGHSNALDPRTYAKLARTAEVPAWRLSGDQPESPSPTAIWVSGHVQAGDFREAIEWDRSRWYSVDVPVPERFRRRAKALEVRGHSMDLEYRPGSIVVWVDFLDFRPPRNGDHVIVYSTRRDGAIEATVKELRVDDDGRRWLWPRSSKPEHQQPVEVLDGAPIDELSGEAVEIKGIVIGDYRPRQL